MMTPRKRKEPQTNLPPKEVKGKEAARVKGGNTKHDTQKPSISNVR